MDDLLPKLLAFPPHPPPQHPLSDHAYDEGIKSLIDFARKTPDGKFLQPTSGGEYPLDVINPILNTVPYAFILVAHIRALEKGQKSNFDGEKLWAKMILFLSNSDPRQIRYLGQEWTFIVETVASFARHSNQTHLALVPIRDALLRLDPSGTTLTSTHLLLAQLALDCRNYQLVAPVLEKFILYIPGCNKEAKPKHLCDMSLSPTAYITVTSHFTRKLKTLDVLEYFLCSGLVYIGLREWENALQCLECAVTYPAKDGAVSKAMVEAYKKWVLVGILIEGKPPSLPKSTSSAASKQYHILGKPYDTMAQLFENASAARLKAEADAGQRVWQGDCNLGLILNVLIAYQQFQIRRLGDVYSKITIPEVHAQTTSAETGNKLPSAQATEALARDMITNGTLNASISSSPNSPSVLTFTSDGPALSEAEVQIELATATQRIHSLNKEIKQTDRMLTHEKDYIKWVQKQKKSGKTVQGDHGISGTDMDWGEDEDLMNDTLY